MKRWAAIPVLLLGIGLVATAEARPKRVKPEAVVAAVEEARRAVEDAAWLAVPPAPVLPARRHIGVTVAGGVSLGVYEAGFMYVFTESMKVLGTRLPLFTGASAGSANAIISAVNSCLPVNADPTEDLGWKVWMGIGYDALFDPARVSSVSLFNRDALILATDHVRERVAEGLPADCDVVLGMATTRSKSRIVTLASGLDVPSQDEKFVFRIRGQGFGKPPLIENYVDPRSRTEQPLMPMRALRHADDMEVALRNFDQLVEVVFASMAFPIAFAPKTLEYCHARSVDPNEALVERPSCETPELRDDFVDGGVYDNNPLRLAHNITRQGMRLDEQGQTFWRDPVSPPARNPPFEGMEYLYVDPGTPAYPTVDEVRTVDDGELIAQVIGLAMSFVETSRSRELYELMRGNAELEGRMRLSHVHYPTASEHLYAFMGFIERDFRLFDYYLGMYDGLKTVEGYAGADHPELNMTQIVREGREYRRGWRPFACMLGYFEAQYSGFRDACQGWELRNFRILLQIALDRMYSHCSALTPGQMGAFHHEHCELATRRRQPPRVEGVLGKVAWQRGEGESDFDHTLRLLTGYGFEFKDLGLTAEQSEKGRYRIRRSILDLVTSVAEAQSSAADRTALLTLGRSAVNDIAYESPNFYGYAVVGSAAEGGASWTPFDWEPNWLRLNMALQAKGLFSALTLDGTGLQLTPLVGPEFEIYPMTSAFVQPIVGLRAGYQFSSVDRYKFDACSESAAVGDVRRCSQVMVQPYVAVTFLERVRFQLVSEIFAESFSFDDRRYNLLLGIGAHFF